MRFLYRGSALAVGAWALTVVGAAQAQENLDQGKSGAQLFASDCAICHKTTAGLSKDRVLGLDSFLREHYTASRKSAAAIANYINATDKGSPPATPARSKKKDAGKPADAKSGDTKGDKAGGDKTGDKKSADQPNIIEKLFQPSSDAPPADAKSGDGKPVGGKTSKPTGAKPAEAKPSALKRAADKPAADKPATDKPAENNPSDARPADIMKPEKKSEPKLPLTPKSD